MDFMNAVGLLLDNLAENILPHSPFLGVTFILLVIGHRVSTRLFTKSRAYRFYGPTPRGKMKWRFFYWGRETLPMQPILIGVGIGMLWRDPEGLGWNRAASVAYFASAGAVSMMLWAVLKGWTKKKGIVLELPGESEPPRDAQQNSVLPYDSLRPSTLFPAQPQPPPLDAASQAASSEEIELEERETQPPKGRGLPNVAPKLQSLFQSPPKISYDRGYGPEEQLESQRRPDGKKP